MGVRLVVGLGNPGDKYDRTRHNMGFMAIDALKEQIAASSSWRGRGEAQLCEATLNGERILLMKPQSFMNLSGHPVSEVMHFYKIALSELVVMHDDVDLPFGKLRIKSGGGDAGHNGLKSIRACLGSGDYIRFRCGVGKPARKDDSGEAMVQWVLGKFSGADKEVAEGLAKRAADALVSLCSVGLAKTQQEFHGE